MSRDTILKDDEGTQYSYDNLKTQGWLEGHVPGIELASNFLMEKAQTLFAGSDADVEKAKLLRALSREVKALTKDAEERAKRHEGMFPVVVCVGVAASAPGLLRTPKRG